MKDKYLVVLGAGRGSRMESRDPDHSKVAYPILGKPLINYVIDACKPLGLKDIFTVVGFGGKVTEQCVKNDSKVVWQHEILGTGHALMQVKDLAKKDGNIIGVSGDIPLLTTQTLRKVYHKHEKGDNALTICTSVLENPKGYGRVIREHGSYRLLDIREDLDCNPEEKDITEVNAGIYIIDNKLLQQYLPKLSNQNAKGEFYLSELVKLFNNAGEKVEAYVLEDAEDIFGVSDRNQLAYAAKVIRKRVNKKLMSSGVSIEDPDTTYISPDVEIGRDTIVLPNTTILGKCKIGEANWLGPNSTIINVNMGNDNKVHYSVLQNIDLKNGENVGPFANINKQK